MINGIFIITSKGESLIVRSFRGDKMPQLVSAYRTAVLGTDARLALRDKEKSEEARNETPIRLLGSTSFFHIKQNDLNFVAVAKENVNAAATFEFLWKFVTILRAYFGTEFSDVTIRNNFVLIYELLDETMDYGYPQVCEPDLLKLYITQTGIGADGKKIEMNTDTEMDEKKITIQATGVATWRPTGIKYKKNQLFIDVIESVNVNVSAKGVTLHSDVVGKIQIKAELSGMPDCKLGLNDKMVMDREKTSFRSGSGGGGSSSGGGQRRNTGIEIDDFTFHQCVKLGKFDSDRTISFVPPDGEFELMRYRTTQNINLPFRVLATVKEFGRSRIEVSLNVKSMFSGKLAANNVVIKCPVPAHTAAADINVPAGKAEYDPEDNTLTWKIKRFVGGVELAMTASVTLSALINEKKGHWARPPINMSFQVPMFTASNLHVRFLKIFEKSNYQTTKWVRYVTKAGNYLYRI